VPWDIERGAEHTELLAMLHVKQGDYAHWAVRIDRASRRVTHVSAGPIIKARDYKNEVRRPRARGRAAHGARAGTTLRCGASAHDTAVWHGS
jgi:hypothetical protein